MLWPEPHVLEPGLLHSASRVPSLLLWFCSQLHPAPSLLFSHVLLNTLWSTTSSLPFSSPSPPSAGLVLAGLSLDALTGPPFVLMRGPLPASEAPLLSPSTLFGIAAPSEARIQSSPILAGVASKGLAPTLLRSTFAGGGPLGN